MLGRRPLGAAFSHVTAPPRLPVGGRVARRVVVLATLALTVSAISALAAGQPHRVVYWLFDRSAETFPQTQVPTIGRWHDEKRAGGHLHQTDQGMQPEVKTIPVLEGEVAGHPFEMQVFLTREFHPAWAPELYVGFNAGGTPPRYYGTDIPTFAGGSIGQPVYGLPGPGPSGDLHWVGWTLDVNGPIKNGGGTGPKYLAGPAAPKVRRVDLVSPDGSVVSVPTFAGPSSIATPVRLWVAALRLNQLVQTIIPRDADGNALEHWHLDQAE